VDRWKLVRQISTLVQCSQCVACSIPGFDPTRVQGIDQKVKEVHTMRIYWKSGFPLSAVSLILVITTPIFTGALEDADLDSKISSELYNLELKSKHIIDFDIPT